MKNMCKHYMKSEDGFCVNYKGDKEHISSCRQDCELYRSIGQKEDSLKRQLEAQINGIEVPYQSE